STWRIVRSVAGPGTSQFTTGRREWRKFGWSALNETDVDCVPVPSPGPRASCPGAPAAGHDRVSLDERESARGTRHDAGGRGRHRYPAECGAQGSTHPIRVRRADLRSI